MDILEVIPRDQVWRWIGESVTLMLFMRRSSPGNTVKVLFCWLLFLFSSLNCWHMPLSVSIYFNVKNFWFCSHFVFVDKNAMPQHVNKKELWLYNVWKAQFGHYVHARNNWDRKWVLLLHECNSMNNKRVKRGSTKYL